MLPAPTSRHIPAYADWLEASCMLDETGVVSESDVQPVLATTAVSEEASESIWLELGNRSAVLGRRYPFTVAQGRLSAKPSSSRHLAYRLMLFLSIRATVREAMSGSVSKPALLFERLVTRAIDEYVGGRALRIGSPRGTGVPRAFRELIPFLSKELNEGPPGEVLLPHAKDGGADVIAWRPFADQRAGQLVLIAQCATGKHWRLKPGDLSRTEWQRWLQFAVGPLKAFAIPHIENDRGQLQHLAAHGGLVLDRLRLCELCGDDLGGRLEPGVATWCREEARRLTTLAGESEW